MILNMTRSFGTTGVISWSIMVLFVLLTPLLWGTAFVMTFLSLIAFDVIATILIIWKLVDVIKQQRGLLNGSVASLILRSGGYFIRSHAPFVVLNSLLFSGTLYFM